MPNPSTIERLPDETDRAFDARTRYVTMGPQRSLEKLRQQIGNRSVRYLEQWSSRFDWQATARAWDDQQAAALSSEAAEQYRADLAAHRKRTMDASQNLIVLATKLAKTMNEALGQPRTIKGADGLTYKLHGIDITSSTLATLSKAYTAALDLEAHALGIDQLLPTLEIDDSE